MAKPTLGYATRTDAVIGLRALGMNTPEIAARLGIATKTVAALESSRGRTRTPKTDRPEGLGRAVLIPSDVLAALGPHAARRGLHPNSLARVILSTVVDEGMIDAVLDDADELRGWENANG